MLYEEFNIKILQKEINKIKEKYNAIPLSYIDNLNKNFVPRPYQLDCFARFEYQFSEWEEDQKTDRHLFFNLATGSGKTFIMAENILFLYEQGYRNFIFFVHQNAILNKTKDNFLNKNSNKYLFAQDIIFNSKKINIREVETFSNVPTDDINIIFTTCIGLHNDINIPQENKMSLESLKNTKIVMIADEAHHLMADTKNHKKTIEYDAEKRSWEETVKGILRLNNENILLEYSATIDLNDENIKEKYEDKIIMKYGLKEYRENGYSKDIYLFKSDLDNNERILSALIMCYYRQSVAEYYSAKSSNVKISFNNGFKPVVLVKSKNINQSKEDMTLFIEYLKNIKGRDIEMIFNNSKNDFRVQKAINWFKDKFRNYDELANRIKNEFCNSEITMRCINSQSKDTSENMLSELNNLDSDKNNVRIIFAVQMLTEGWDVLCLYDIVRLDEKTDKKTVTSDIQLIGRGCRYNPFFIENYDDKKYTRKFDDELENDLRCLEEFYYHSKNDNKYISSLQNGLVEVGLKDNDDLEQPITHNVRLKTQQEVKSRWANRIVYSNDLEEVKYKDKNTLFDYSVPSQFNVQVNTKDKSVSTINIFIDKNIENKQEYIQTKMSIDRAILRKAMDSNPFYTFKNLSIFLPNMKTKDELLDFIEKEISINIDTVKSFEISELSRKDQLKILADILKKIEKIVKSHNYKKKGSYNFTAKWLKDVLKSYPKTISKRINNNNRNSDGLSIYEADERHFVDVKNKDWYAFEDFYGDSLEKELIYFINSKIEDKTYPFDKCENLLLVRNNARICKLHDFNSDRGFEPDFLLFFTKDEEPQNYMIFIEPKGEHLKGEDNDLWKQRFLLDIEEKAIIKDNKNGKSMYKIIGLPFYTEKDNKFPESLQEMFEKNNIR